MAARHLVSNQFVIGMKITHHAMHISFYSGGLGYIEIILVMKVIQALVIFKRNL